MATRWFLVFLLILTGCENGNAANEDTTVKKGYTEVENIARSIKRLDAFSRWIIENGIMEIFTNSAYKDKFDKLSMLSKFASSIGVSDLENEDGQARFSITSYSTNYDIYLLQRGSYNGSTYEYWIILISSSYQEYHDDCRFIITRSDSIKSSRTILKESGQFFHEYTEGNAVAFSLDYEDDMYVRYMLSAWDLPQCYKNYPHLPQKEVRATGRIDPIDPRGKGSYEFVPFYSFKFASSYLIIIVLLVLLYLHYSKVFGYFRDANSRTTKSNILVTLSLMTSLVPLGTLLAYSLVFLQGGHFVRQFSASHELWVLWYTSWNFLTPALRILGLVATISFLMDIRKKQQPLSFWSRLYILLAYPICLFVLKTAVPDA